MPMSIAFENRLYPLLEEIVAHFGTPFHIYDEAGIRETGYRLKRCFCGIPGFCPGGIPTSSAGLPILPKG